MNKNVKKFLALLIAVMILSSLFVGCGSSSDKGESSTSKVEPVAQTSGDTPEEKLEKITFTQLVVKNANIDSLLGGDFSKTPAAMELEKRTNVHIETIPVANEDYDTQLSLMISSGQQPDLMGLPSNYPGGPVQAVADGVLVKISDYMDKLTPNLKKVLASNPEWEKNAKADDGSVISFPCIREDSTITVFSGPMIRKDLLDAAGLALPETIDEWHTALTAFKKNGVKTPLSGLNWMDGYTAAFSGAYGALNSTGDCYVGADRKMHYGPIEPGYKEFLTTMAQWYKEGLVGADFFTSEDWGGNDTNVNSGNVGATVHFISYIGDYTSNLRKTIPNAQFVATKHAVLKKGDQPLYGQNNPPLSSTTGISAKCKNIERAIQYMDYGYSEEGKLLMNFGIEGESYTMVDGKPTYTDLITATPTNSKGWNLDQSLAMYCPAANDSATVQMKSYFEQVRIKSQEQKDALAFWSIPKYSVSPTNATYTNAESIVARKLSDVKTYADEMRARFVMGTEPIANFDKFVKRCKELGIDDVLMVYNDAYNRFNKR